MNRRDFSLLTGAGLLAATMPERAGAQTAVNPALLQTTLTPFGAERQGNAAGTIPAWTGGMTEVPAGVEWDPSKTVPPDFWADEQPLYTVTSDNVAQYGALLTDGVKRLISEGMSVQVFPTHRTASAPQWVYDNTAVNATRAQPEDGGARLGFKNAYGGIPFPIPDPSDPYNAGAEIIWNNQARWSGEYQSLIAGTYVVIDGAVTLAQTDRNSYFYTYYQKDGSLDTYNGHLGDVNSYVLAPSNQTGGETITHMTTDPVKMPIISWQLLAGQGRVRKTPNFQYDTPSPYAAGMCNLDEYFGFSSSQDQYDWKLLGKQEMLIPYNNNKLLNVTVAQAHGPKFINPEVLRWELHRVWVVDATLHPGKRNVLAHRRFYVDEDTWIIGVVDSWDANGEMFHHAINVNFVFPNLPGTLWGNTILYNMQTNSYVSILGSWGEAPYNTPWDFTPKPMSLYDPQSLAASASY